MIKILRLFLLVAASLFGINALAQCENYSVQIFSDVAEGGPTAVDWVLTDINGDTLYEGNAIFNAFTFFSSTTVCLDDGDYTLLFTGDVPLMGGAFLAGVQQNGDNIFPTNEVVFGELIFLYEFNTQPLVIDCNASFTWEETITPGLVQFQSTSTHAGNGITYGWEFAGDTQPGPENPIYQYATNGTYNACLNIVATQDGQVGCIDTECQNVVIAGFTNGEICPGNISVTILEAESCGNYHFALQDAEVGASIAWFPLGGEDDFILSEETDYYYAAPGIYELCVAYQSELCPSGTQICEEIAVLGCSDCPEILQIISSDCGEALLQFGDVNTPSTNVSYDWNDGLVTNGGVAQIHSYAPINEVYNVCATYTNAYCAEGVTECVELDYAGCFEEVCPTVITVSNAGCFLYTLAVEGSIPGATYAWNVSGSLYSTPTVNYTIPFPNTVNISVVYTGDNCPDGVALNSVITYDDCGAVCPGAITSQQTDCNVYELSFSNVTANMQATWTINGEVFTGSEITYELADDVPYNVTVVVTNPSCPNPINLSTTLSWDDCAIACPQNIVATNLGCNVYELTTDIAEEGAVSSWSIAGAEFLGGVIYYTLPNQSDVAVAMNYTSAQCSFGVDLNTVLTFEECSVGCPEEIIVVELGCNTYQLSLNVSEGENISWDINGQEFSGNNLGFLLPASGAYIITAYYDGSDCSGGISLQTILDYEACDAVCPTEIIVVENLCNDYQFIIDVDYPQLGAIWTVDGDTLSTTIDFTYTLPEDGDYEISAYYTGPDCPLGTTLTSLFTYVNCNDVCPTELVVDSIGCNNYVLSLNNIAANEQAVWTINGQTLPAISSVNITVAESGTTVGVYYEGTECTSGIEFNTAFDYNVCGDGSCDASFTYTLDENGEVLFTNTSTYDGVAEFLWDFAEGNVSNEVSPIFQFVSNGIYYVCLTLVTENCEDTYCTEVSVESVFVCDENEIEVTIDGINSNNATELLYYSILDAANDTVATIVIPFPVGQSSNTQVFCLPDGCYSFSADEPINLSAIALSILNVTNSSLLIDIDLPASELDTTIFFGVNADCPDNVLEIESGNSLNVYPNPANDMVRIQSILSNSNATLQLIDMTGRVVHSEKMNSAIALLSLAGFSSGIYTVRYELNGIATIGRLEIMR